VSRLVSEPSTPTVHYSYEVEPMTQTYTVNCFEMYLLSSRFFLSFLSRAWPRIPTVYTNYM